MAEPRKSTAAAGLARLRRSDDDQGANEPPVVEVPSAPEVQPPEPPSTDAVRPRRKVGRPTKSPDGRTRGHLIGGRFTDDEKQRWEDAVLAAQYALKDRKLTGSEILAALLDRYLLDDVDANMGELVNTIHLYRDKQFG